MIHSVQAGNVPVHVQESKLRNTLIRRLQGNRHLEGQPEGHLNNLSPHGLVDCEVASRVCHEGAGKLRQPGPARNMTKKAHEASVLSAGTRTKQVMICTHDT